jgi:thiamine biosynthesis lipoprotein
VVVHRDTISLFEKARAGWEATGGRFDPMVLPAVIAGGYSVSLDEGTPTPHHYRPLPSPGFDAVRIIPRRNIVRLDLSARFDPGAIGKGLAADMVTQFLIETGARGALVSIGGDIRVAGSPPVGGWWSIGIEDPAHQDTDLAVLAISEGGVATSTSRHGRWQIDGKPVDHVCDPRTGTRTDTDVTSATVLAADAWMAEVAATAIVVSGVAAGLRALDDLKLDGLIVATDGNVHTTARLADCA